MNRAVMCVVKTEASADSIVRRLQAVGFPDGDISVVFPDRKRTTDFAEEHDTRAPEGALEGGVIGGTVGLIAGIGALAIPGFGPLLAAGPLLGALSGAAAGAAVGGVASSLVGMGIPEEAAKRYEGRLKAGDTLIYVQAETPREVRRAEAIFAAERGEEISVAVEDTGSPPELGAHPAL